MKLSQEQLQDIIDNPTNENINSLLSLNYSEIDFAQLNYCLDGLTKKRENNNNNDDIKYILCLAILCKETAGLKQYLETNKLITPSNNYNSLVVYLIQQNLQSWCKYETLTLLLVYGKHWEFFINELFQKTWLLDIKVDNKNIWEIALDNKDFGFIKYALSQGIIQYNQVLKRDANKHQEYTIFDYLMSYGYFEKIKECLDLVNKSFSDIESIWFTAVDKGYHQLVYDKAKDGLFDSKTLADNNFHSVWCEMLISDTERFNDKNIDKPKQKRFEIVIKAMENNLCNINQVGYNFFTSLSDWGEFEDLHIDVQNTLKNRMTIAIAKIIKSQKVDIKQINECNWKDGYRYDFKKFKEGLSFYILREKICNIESTLFNSNACLSYAILSNAVNSQSINNIAKAAFKEALHTLSLKQLSEINIDPLFLEIFYHEIKIEDITQFDKLPNYSDILHKLIQNAPKNDENCMKNLGDAIYKININYSSINEDNLIPIWQIFAEKYDDIFAIDSNHDYKKEFTSKFVNPCNDFQSIFHMNNKRSAITYQYDNLEHAHDEEDLYDSNTIRKAPKNN